MNRKTGKLLDIHAGTSDNWAELIQYSDNGGDVGPFPQDVVKVLSEKLSLPIVMDKLQWENQAKDEPPVGELVTVKGQNAIVVAFSQSNPLSKGFPENFAEFG